MRDAHREAVYREWVIEYYQAVYRWSFRYAGNPHDAADLTQETFTLAFRHMSQFRGDSSPRTWLLSIATRAWMRKARRAGTAREWTDGDDIVESSVVAPSAEAEALAVFDRDALWALVRSLPERECVALNLFYGEELSYSEIAVVMNVNLQQVRNYIHRGRRRLRGQLERRAGQDG